ncbi:MAG: hypothetical protein HRT53_13235 [Colwellia sp.]|nr:hypothetical protein [Colwellia sp.]
MNIKSIGLALSILLSFSAQADVSGEKNSSIKKLLDKTPVVTTAEKAKDDDIITILYCKLVDTCEIGGKN